MDTEIKCVVCDLGGVYFTAGTHLAVEKIKDLIEADAATAREVDRIFIGAYRDIGHDYRSGDVTAEEFWTQTKARLKVNDEVARQMERIWWSSYVPNEGMPELIRALKATGQYHLVIFSGNIKERIEYLDARYHILEVFDDWVMSYDYHLDKDTLEFYEVLLDKIPHAPAETVLIDDYRKYCRMAEGLGMHAIKFTDHLALRADLAKLGMEIPSTDEDT